MLIDFCMKFCDSCWKDLVREFKQRIEDELNSIDYAKVRSIVSWELMKGNILTNFHLTGQEVSEGKKFMQSGMCDQVSSRVSF